MKKFWLVFLNEYKRHVLRKRFIIAILSMPLFVGFMALIGFLTVWLQNNTLPVGYIDQTNVLPNAQQIPVEKKSIFNPVTSILFSDEPTAKKALDNGEIQAYFIISDQYLNNGSVDMVSTPKTGYNAEDDFGDFVAYNITRGLPDDVVERLNKGPDLIIQSPDGSREMDEDNWMVIMLPMLAGLLFIIAVNISGGYLLQAVVEEKENRTMEILVTSISPTQLMAGKVVGDLMVGLTQLVCWVVFVILGLTLAPVFFDMQPIPMIEGKYILLLLATLLPAFVMIAAAMGAVGATATEMREAQQVAGWFTLPVVVPFWFVSNIMYQPNGVLATIFSMFPLTAPIAMPLRAAFTNVPWWQIAITILVLCLLAWFALWMAGKIFRIGMLRYGKKVSLKEAFQRN